MGSLGTHKQPELLQPLELIQGVLRFLFHPETLCCGMQLAPIHHVMWKYQWKCSKGMENLGLFNMMNPKYHPGSTRPWVPLAGAGAWCSCCWPSCKTSSSRWLWGQRLDTLWSTLWHHMAPIGPNKSFFGGWRLLSILNQSIVFEVDIEQVEVFRTHWQFHWQLHIAIIYVCIYIYILYIYIPTYIHIYIWIYIYIYIYTYIYIYMYVIFK